MRTDRLTAVCQITHPVYQRASIERTIDISSDVRNEISQRNLVVQVRTRGIFMETKRLKRRANNIKTRWRRFLPTWC